VEAGAKWDSISAIFFFTKRGLVAKEMYSISISVSGKCISYFKWSEKMTDLHWFSAPLQTTHLEVPLTAGETGTEWDPRTSGLFSCI
jgi:hypothetical protein